LKLRTAIEWNYGILPSFSIKGLPTDKNVHFYEIIRLLLCFFSGLYFLPKHYGKNIRSASGFFIAGNPKYSACLYFKLLKSYPNKYIYN
jgi:hypothetical protein